MTTTTFDVLDPVLASDLPPVGAHSPSLFSRLRDELARRRVERSFERALREADPAQAGDLLALARRR